jgi:deoxyribonuclease-4
VIQEGDQGDTVIWDINHTIENGDILVSFSSPIAPSYSMLKDIGNLAKELDVMLSLHTPYHMKLCGDKEQAASSILWNIWGGVMASAMDAAVVITNIGVPQSSGPAASAKNLVRNIDEILKQFKKLRINAKLGLQPSPKPEIYGTLDEILAICKRYHGEVIPILNFPNIHLRMGGVLKDQSDVGPQAF